MSNVEPVEKVRWQKLQEKRPPYLPFKRRSQIEEPFWYPHFGQFSVVRDFFYSLVRRMRVLRYLGAVLAAGTASWLCPFLLAVFVFVTDTKVDNLGRI